MSELQDSSERLSLPYQAERFSTERSSFLHFLTYLVFEGHGLRVGLELSFCVVSYLVTSTLVPWQAWGVPLKWSTLISWFGCCFAIVLFDQIVLCHSVHTLRRAYLLSLAGAYEKALVLLEKIGPRGSAWIRMPQPLYHLHRAEMLTNAESFRQAESELQLAQLADVNHEQLALAKSRYQRMRFNFDEAKRELNHAIVLAGETPVLLMETALVLLEEGEDLWKAKSLFRKIMDMPDEPHFLGESTHQLAKAYWNVTRLRTGEAEEGLEELGRSVSRLRSAIVYVDTLRPVLAQILLERAHYYATHREPSAAVMDFRLALLLCSYPNLRSRAEKIKSELEYRYQVVL